jgi:Fe-S oxidoreductase
MEAIKTVIAQTRASLCYECGKCAAHCPIAKFNPDYSPRRTMTEVVQGNGEDLLQNGMIWPCLTRGLCEQYCPSNVAYSAFMKQMRDLSPDPCDDCSHGGAMQSVMRSMASSEGEQDRMDWIMEDLQVAEKGEWLYFVGCLPYFDVFFSNIGAASLQTGQSTVRILNALDIQPVVLKGERCCGHDLLWEGDVENFEKLASRNLAAIKRSGAKTVVVSCAECARTLRMDYQDHFGTLDFKVLHLTELLAEKIDAGQFSPRGLSRKVTYQDPCRLGRHLGVYDAPRKVMASIPGVELVEMPKSGKDSVCCGTSAWTHCDVHAKQIQTDRLKSASETGAEVLVTTCPKCAIHFKCAQSDNGMSMDVPIQIQDLEVLVAEAL